MLSCPYLQGDILKALATGKTVISRAFKRFDSHHVRFAMAYPIYKLSFSGNSTVDQRCKAAAGYMGAIFRFDSFAEHVLGQIDVRHTISVSIYDATESPDCLLLYRWGNHENSRSLLHESELKLGDPCRRYRVMCRYQHKAPLPWIPIVFSGLTILIELLLGCILIGSTVHSLKIQELNAQAEAFNTTNSQFLSEASQEIRKPAYSVLETLRLVLRMELTSPQRDYIQVAREGWERLIDSIYEVLEPGKLKPPDVTEQLAL
ncbi:histidine kinase 4-like isoform X2 [Punica granatum]|uniref:histidine kinase n=1 Tax=Punica granatum TaxID=22663 RepID=A0A6P8E8V0_PUNGR|nr:histidine kinase 4-like isoform X2 [Punica granatum]